MLVHIIADYGKCDLAFAEVVQRLKMHLPQAEPMLLSVPPFSTLAAGFCVAQLGLNQAPPGALIYHNVAPRADDRRPRPRSAGEPLAVALLPTGVRVIGVNAGHAFSFVRDLALELRRAAAPANGSSFRSRDLFPQVAAAIARGESRALGEAIDPEEIPAVPPSHVSYIDGYGNLKTTLEPGPEVGAAVWVRIGAVELEALACDTVFAVAAGKLAFAPGSSGWRDRKGREVRWMELFLRGGSAWEAFGRPRIGDPLEVVTAV
jgi:hypothetical protein